MEAQATSKTETAAACQYLTFRLGSESYAIDILMVQEIRGYDAVTRIAHAPEHVKGVINLRGVIVPILDLRLKLGVGEATYHEFTVVIVLNLLGKVIGVVVDSVSDVVALSDDGVQPAPELGGAVDTCYLAGIATVNEEMLILIDMEKLVGGDDLQAADATRH
ncbi:chemotaxis protein CheW [Geomonas sp.]|uniref:chemotaxis protein CheW n=1 Tax=Geomonas sp. TaxID=2651584 RepID=UPI002B45C438|nr:chemotaxis protein CheW [Geomonas sp.]HJV35005.1 chemotaxis protein CheW [Geomonas sp.]